MVYNKPQSVPVIIDRKRLHQLRLRASIKNRCAKNNPTFLLDHINEELVERLTLINREWPVIIDLGGLGKRLTEVFSRDLSSHMFFRMDSLISAGGHCVFNEELLPFKEKSISLFLSAGHLHWVNDLLGTFIQIKQALKADGLFMAALPIAGTLFELEESLRVAESELLDGVAPHVHPFPTLQTLGDLVHKAGFALPVIDEECYIIRYENLFSLLRDLKNMGASNSLSKRSGRSMKRDVITRAEKIYRDRFADDDGKIRVSYHMAFISAWAPHSSQQKPLRKGAAKMRLADALKES